MMRKFYFAALTLSISFAASAALPQADYSYLKKTPANTALSVAAEAENAPGDIIVTPPEGKTCLYLRSGENYAMFGTLFPMPGIVENIVNQFVYTDNGEVYIKNIISSYPTNSYVKGQVEEGKITLELPQAIEYVDGPEGTQVECYVDRAAKEPYNGDYTYVPDTERTITFNVAEDGTVELEPTNDGEVMLALMDADGNWLGYGDWKATFTLFDEGEGPLVMPDNLETEDFLFVADGLSHFVKVAFDGNDIYMKGLFKTFPEGCFKGTLTDDNKIRFKSGQYLGFEESGASSPLYFVGAEISTTPNGHRTKYDIIDEAMFDYNPETKTMKSKHALLLNASTTSVKYTEYFREPIVRINGEDYEPIPMNPYFIAYNPWNNYDQWCGIQFRLPNITDDLNYIDSDKIFWRMFINGETLEFDPDNYPQFTEVTEWVPFNHDGMEINNFGTSLHTVILFIEDINTIGVQGIFDDGEKQYYTKVGQYDIESGNVEYFDPQSGVENIDSEAVEVVSAAYFSIDGARIQKPANGIYVKRSVMSDGTVSTSKVIMK